MKAATAWTNLVTGIANISIHAAREGGDDVDYIDKLTHTLFQSTPPVKAATAAVLRKASTSRHFNPRRP